MSEAPPEVVALAERRAAARAAKDFAESDRLRDAIAGLGWVVRDAPDGWSLAAKPPYEVFARVADLPDHSGAPDTRDVTVAILAEGWPDDVRRAAAAVRAHTDAYVLVLDVTGALDPIEGAEVLHLAADPGWAAARTALLKADTARVHVWLDPSVEPTGDAVGPLVAALADPTVVAAGGWGVNVSADWQSFADAPAPGDVDALNGYLAGFRRADLLAIGGPHPKARFYRNADIETCYALRAATGGRCVMTAPPPAVRHRHRGYHDSDPAYRDRESKRNYDRFLQRFRPR